MERRKPALTLESYTKAIISLSRRYSSTSAFPGNNYMGIGDWMLQDRGLFSSIKREECATLFASKSEQPHDLVVVYDSGDKKWDVHAYGQDRHEAFSATKRDTAENSGQIVFIRGFISPRWVSTIGSKYSIDPEFFKRHMDFLSASVDRHAFSFPSLASSANNIFRLCVSTLMQRDNFGGQDLHSQRSDHAAALKAYKMQQLCTTRACCGDSVVREYSTICSSFSVIEQWISLYIEKTSAGWTVIAWMDQGRPLERSPPGPWTSHIASHATPLPIVQHHPKMAFRTTINRLNPDANASAEVQQSTALLPLQYDSVVELVDLARRAPQDPLSMCIPLCTHAAFSEVQFLNLMESRIQIQINTVAEGVPADTLGTLQYFSNILTRHSYQLKDSARAITKLAERSVQVPNAPSDSAFTIKGILEDYEQLHVRCTDLADMCARGITLAMNKAAIDESRKAIEQSERLKKLTVLATLFIPLNFSSSLFGMNIDLLGQSTVSFWWFIVLCVPITLAAYIFHLWDFQAVRRSWVKFRNVCHEIKLMVGPEKIPLDQLNHVAV